MKRDFLFTLVSFGLFTILAIAVVIQAAMIAQLNEKVDSLGTRIDLMTITDSNLTQFAADQARINTAILGAMENQDVTE